MGSRLISDCMPIPMVCFAAERFAATSENIAGSENELHARNRNVAPITAGHRGTRRTSRYPAMEIPVNATSPLRCPQRSTTAPPGYA